MSPSFTRCVKDAQARLDKLQQLPQTIRALWPEPEATFRGAVADLPADRLHVKSELVSRFDIDSGPSDGVAAAVTRPELQTVWTPRPRCPPSTHPPARPPAPSGCKSIIS